MGGVERAGGGTRLDAERAYDVSIIGIVAAVGRRQRLVLWITALAIAVGVVVAALRERSWTAHFTFLPTADPDASRAGLASLAGQFGLALPNPAGSARPPQFYADLLRSREILAPIASESVMVDGRSISVSELVEVEGDDPGLLLDETIRALQTKVVAASVAARTTGVVSARVRTRDRAASLWIAGRLVEELNEFNVRSRSGQAGEERRFVSAQLELARDSLRVDEDRLRNFLLSNRDQGGSPRLTVERDRLQREVTLRLSILDGLTKAYHDARIREVRDTPVLLLVDQPAAEIKADARGRLVLLIGVTLGGLVAGVFVALLVDSLSRPGVGGAPSAIEQLRAAWRGR